MGIGAISLMVITNVVGIWSISWFVYRYLEVRGILFFAMLVFALLFSAFFILLYFRLRVLNDLLLKIKFLRKYERFFSILKKYDQKKLFRVFSYSLARFIVFTSQYCILLQVLLPELPFIPMVLMTFLLFFVQSALPSLDLFDVGVRSITASYFFGFLTDQNVAVMAIAAFIWFVNLIVPAIIGSFFTFKINFFDTNS